MGYFKRPIRRSVARRARLAHLEPARAIRDADWKLCGRSIVPAADSFLRFVVERPRLGKVGLFQSSELVEDSEDVPASALVEMEAAFDWFNENLPVPKRLPKNAICWFRADAHESLARLRTLIEIYRMVGHAVWMQATRNPGRVVYRDDYQVAAVPYPDRHTTASAV